MSITSKVLVVGGGASGGANVGGGGGAGAVRYDATHALSFTTYTVTVGAGGAAVTGPSDGNDGGNSVFDTITSLGGGGGGIFVNGTGNGTNGHNGGSGGGGGATNTGTPGSGGTGNTGVNNGGAGHASLGAGGGGGAGAVGADGGSNVGGNGGNGVSNSITGSAVTYGGGGGGSSNGGTMGTGGTGGGGTAADTGGAGTDSLGGGGGAGGTTSGKGGKGVVIIAFTTGSFMASATGTFAVTTSGGDTIYSFTGSGTFTASDTFTAALATGTYTLTGENAGVNIVVPVLLAGVFSLNVSPSFIQQDSASGLVMEAQNSYGLAAGSGASGMGILIDNSPSILGQDSYYSAWSNGMSVGGIDYNNTTLWSNFEPTIETEMIPTGTNLEAVTFGQAEYKLDRALVSGDQIRLSFRTSLSDSYTVIGTSTSSTATISEKFISNIRDSQWVQFKVEFACTPIASSFVPLREIRLHFS